MRRRDREAACLLCLMRELRVGAERVGPKHTLQGRKGGGVKACQVREGVTKAYIAGEGRGEG